MGKISPCAGRHADIIRLVGQGMDVPEIAAALGFGRHALAGYMQRHGLRSGRRRGKRPQIDRTRISELVAAGRTQEQVAEELGCSRSAIERASKKMLLQTARTGPRTGEGHPDWKGGRRADKHGYVEVYAPLHPEARNVGRVFEHRLVMEVELGRYLQP
jgi:DNA-binding CsgD family transcriptional regulator